MSVLPPVLDGGLQVSCILPAVRQGVDFRSSGGVGGPEGVTDCRSEGLKAICTSQDLQEWEVLTQSLQPNTHQNMEQNWGLWLLGKILPSKHSGAHQDLSAACLLDRLHMAGWNLNSCSSLHHMLKKKIGKVSFETCCSARQTVIYRNNIISYKTFP